MYAVRSWNEEVVKWLAVGMCLAMVGMAVMPDIVLQTGIVATAAALIACTLGAAGAAALLIMGAPIAVE